MSTRIKRNIFFSLSLIGLAVIVARVVAFCRHDCDWWELLSAIIISVPVSISISDTAKRSKPTQTPNTP